MRTKPVNNTDLSVLLEFLNLDQKSLEDQADGN
jgi:hypothetical protein